MENEHNFFNSDGFSQDSFTNSLHYQDQYNTNNATIKEKLNLHVKRRLLETIPYNTSISSRFNGTTATQCDEFSCEPSKPKSKRGRKSKKTSTITSGSLSDDKSHNTKTIIETNLERNMLSPNFSTNNSHQQVRGNKSKDKEKQQEIDQFFKILNEKKLTLMRDPTIIQFLDDITMKLRSKKQVQKQ